MTNKPILITGGTGSLGTALSQRLVAECSKLIIFSRDWVKQLDLFMDLHQPRAMRRFIGDVRDKGRLRRAFEGVDVVIHAAAIKDIHACSYNVEEALATNTVGTQNVIGAAIDCDVEKVLFISTDKSVEALNSYGKSKALAEDLITRGNTYASGHRTMLSSVRYGNVVGSRGSVVEIFKRQVKEAKANRV